MARSTTARPADLVLEGGGVKGIGLAGAVAAMTDRGWAPHRISGTSAGALVGAMVAAGARGEQLREITARLNFREVADPSGLGRVPLVGPALAFLGGQGLYQGEWLHSWVEEELAALGVRTFGDLRIDDPALPRSQRYRLVVTCSDLTLGQLVRLPWDYRSVYGLDPDRQSVADAVRASMAIPFLFKPTTLTNPRTDVTSTLVDGGLLSNFPIDSLDRTDGREPAFPTFGVTITTAPKPGIGDRVALFHSRWFDIPQPAPLRLLEQLITTMLLGRDQAVLNQPWVAARTIHIDAGAVGLLDFGISPERARALYDTGYAQAAEFLEQFDWRAYKRRFRRDAHAAVSGAG
ncbi:patatin-like phospholipase family protein [Actinomycetospora callitridis]|uniref:patatin-like phospholipase family protein n=1 Tax=Actinomycetospora callitridis TaxID=913944 RepID=UPI002366D401|nr:patatin-like phospholipase family protein [Actinomycetospora callitridis]MDD7917258.1 patatin-like phospholipase family protein [Actinomycetospora callitridis]